VNILHEYIFQMLLSKAKLALHSSYVFNLQSQFMHFLAIKTMTSALLAPACSTVWAAGILYFINCLYFNSFFFFKVLCF